MGLGGHSGDPGFLGTENSGHLVRNASRSVMGVSGGVLLGEGLAALTTNLPAVQLAVASVCLFLTLYLMPVCHVAGTAMMTSFLAKVFSLTGQPTSALLVTRLAEVGIGAASGLAASFVVPLTGRQQAVAAGVRTLFDAAAQALRSPADESPAVRAAHRRLVAAASPELPLLSRQAPLRHVLSDAARLAHLIDIVEDLPPDDRASLAPRLAMLAGRIDGSADLTGPVSLTPPSLDRPLAALEETVTRLLDHAETRRGGTSP
jgi:uncharacterized membrane protein YccC